MKEMENLSEKFLKISQALLAWLILVILSPVVLLVFGSLCIWKYGVLWVVVKLFKRKFLVGFQDSEAIFAVDRYWESSRSSLGLIVELEGTINVDTFRDEFRKKMLELSLNPDPFPSQENVSSTPKPFSKLLQIPATFAGYYYWQKANYFLIHEHIRQINQPTDELGLKKAVGTLMTLPFPNRRPLWEILVYSNYLGTTTVGRGTTCGAALFIRIHRSVTDSQGLMNLLQNMVVSTTTANIKSVRVSCGGEDHVKGKEPENEPKNGFGGGYNLVISKIPDLVLFPLRRYRFAQEMIKIPEGIAKSESCGEWDSANASWTTLSDVLIRKICRSQVPNLSRSAVEMCLFLEGISSQHSCPNVPEEKGVPTRQGKCRNSVLVLVSGQPSITASGNLLPNEKSFFAVKCSCISSLCPNKATLLKAINQQLQSRQMGQNPQIFRIYMKLLGLLPRHFLRFLIMSKKWGAGCLLYEQFPVDLHGTETLDKEEHKMFGIYQIAQVVPLVGLQWTHTVASATTVKWQGNIVMSLIANAGILGPMTQGNPQEHAERIIRSLPEELEKLTDDAEDHGFVSIPIA